MKIKKFNEYVNNDKIIVENLMNDVQRQCGNMSDLERMSQSESYRNLVNYGKKAIPFLLEETSPYWLAALNELTELNLDTTKYNHSKQWQIIKEWSKENGYL